MGQMEHLKHLPGTVRRLFPKSGGHEDMVPALKHSTFTWGTRQKTSKQINKNCKL